MLAQFSIIPMGARHMTPLVAEVIELVDRSGLNYRVGPMGTAVEGPWEEVMGLIKECHELALERRERVITQITVDESNAGQHTLQEMVDVVELHLHHAVAH
jgi:uncharacterized protein (TIGR00106 family)